MLAESAMCHSSGSRNPGCFVPATVLLDRKQAPGNMDPSYVRESRLRGNDEKAPSPGLAFGQAGLSQRGGCFIRLKCDSSFFPANGCSFHRKASREPVKIRLNRCLTRQGVRRMLKMEFIRGFVTF